MTVTLELTADEACVLQEIAQRAETTIEAVLHALVAQVSPSLHAPSESAEFESVESESVESESVESESVESESVESEGAESESAEAEAERRREQEEVEANIRRWHAERAAP